MYYMIYVPFIPCSCLNLFSRVGRRPGEMSILSPLGQFPPPLMDNYLIAPDGQHIGSTVYIHSSAVYVYCVDDWNGRGESICLFPCLQ